MGVEIDQAREHRQGAPVDDLVSLSRLAKATLDRGDLVALDDDGPLLQQLAGVDIQKASGVDQCGRGKRGWEEQDQSR